MNRSKVLLAIIFYNMINNRTGGFQTHLKGVQFSQPPDRAVIVSNIVIPFGIIN